MSALETLSLVSLTLGAAGILRFIWLDSLRFSDTPQGYAEVLDPLLVSPRTVRRLALQAEAARVRDDNAGLPRAA